MKKSRLHLILVFATLILLLGSWFGVLYSEERRRLAQAAEERAAFMARLEEIDRDRKAYYESVTEQRRVQAAAMEAARAQYEELLKNQAAAVKAQAKPVVQTVQKPVTKTETVTTAKPKSTRSTKTS